MADGVVLGVSQLRSIHALRTLAEAREQATRRLATGREVSRITDNARDYLKAGALTGQAAGLLDGKAAIGLAIDSLAAANTGLEAAQKLAAQMQGLAQSAQGADADTRAELAAQFDTVRQQLDALIGDTSFNGVNLLSDPADSVNVAYGGTPGTGLTIEGQASDAATLGVGDSTSYGSFATDADVAAAALAAEDAIATLRSTASGFATDGAILNVRETFNQNLADTLRAGADKLTEADLNAEAARLLTVQTRDALAREGLRVTSQSQSQLATLIGG